MEFTSTRLKPLSPPEHQILNRDPHVIVYNLTVSLGRVVIPEHQHWPDHSDAGRVSRDDDNALLIVLVAVVCIGLAHDKVHATTRVARAADKPAN